MMRQFLHVHSGVGCAASHRADATEEGEKVELPPALLIQGTADKGVPKGMVERVAELYHAAGGEVDLALFPNMPHGMAGWPEPDVARMIERIKAFIARRLAAAG